MMRKKQRDDIKRNFVRLVRDIEPNDLAQCLLEENAITKEEVENIFLDQRDYKHNNRLLLFHILKKGDHAYSQFKQAMERCHLSHILTSETSRPHATVFRQPDTSNEEVSLSVSNLSISNMNNTADIANLNQVRVGDSELDEKLIFKVKLANNIVNLDNIYSTTSEKRGQVLIINNKKFEKQFDNLEYRRGSERDVECLKSVFEQMYLTVTVYEDLNVMEMKRVIREFAEYDAYKICDICVVVIMSHGGERSDELVVFDKEKNILPSSWIEDQFSNISCPLFCGKPKLFFYQFCRGILPDYAITKQKDANYEVNELFTAAQTIESDSGSISTCARRKEDMLVGYATQKGRRAHRDPTLGSWYIQEICRVLSDKAHETDIITILNEVDRNLKRKTTAEYTMQTSSYTSHGFNHALYFNPGIYVDASGNLQKFG